MTHQKNKYARRLTPLQEHDVWEIPMTDDITEELTDALKELGVDTEEVDRAFATTKRRPTPGGGKKNG